MINLCHGNHFLSQVIALTPLMTLPHDLIPHVVLANASMMLYSYVDYTNNEHLHVMSLHAI